MKGSRPKTRPARPGSPSAPAPRTLAAFWAAEDAAWRTLSAAWRGLPDDALTRPGACGPAWSVKDVWNHLAAWMDATRAALPALLARRPMPKGAANIPDFNADHYAADRDRPLASSRRRLQRARRAFLACVAALPAAAVLDDQARPGRWIKFATYGHYAEHLPALQTYRRETLGR